MDGPNACRVKRAPRFVDDGANAIWIVGLPRDQYLKIIRQANETTIEHPMRGSRKSNSIADDIWSVLFYGSDMRGGNFSSAANLMHGYLVGYALDQVGRALLGGIESAASDAAVDPERIAQLAQQINQ